MNTLDKSKHNTGGIALNNATKPSPDGSGRILSIDVFRGLTILTMIFVNDLASVRGIPLWMQHMPAEADGMTFVDLVFPAFLFIVGMAVPLAVNNRLKKGVSVPVLWKHILLRTAGLLTLGILMVNISGLNEELVGINRHLWMLLVLISAIIVWNQYPKYGSNEKQLLYKILRGLGFAGLITLAAVYRRGTGDNITWLHTSWWGILGLIGWAYLFSSAIYLGFRKHIGAVLGFIALSVFLYLGDRSGKIEFLNYIKDYLWLGGHVGGHLAIALAGTVVSMLFTEESPVTTVRGRVKWILMFAAVLFIGGYLLRPFYGISKIYSTPAWSLYSSAYCCLIFLFLYWLIDIKQIKNWGNFLKPAGSNPLLAYLLPDIYYSIIWLAGFTFISENFGFGIPGIIRSLVFAFVMVWLTGLLNKINIRLHL